MRRPPLPSAVVVPGETFTSWSNRLECPATAPTAVAVDRGGRVWGFGSEALREVGRRGKDLALVRPFTSSSIRRPELAAGFIRWLLGVGCRRVPRIPTAFLVPSDPTAHREWSKFVSELSIQAVTLCRVLAATAGLGLEATSAAHMVLIAEHNGAEIAVIADGDIVFSRQVESLSPRHVSAEVISVLRQVDPDLEWDVAERGVHVVGNGLDSQWVSTFTESLQMKVVTADLQAMVDGARASLEVVGSDLPRPRNRLTTPLGRRGRLPDGPHRRPPHSGYSFPSW